MAETNRNPYIIALVGASGSGKTEVARVFGEAGFKVFPKFTTRPQRTNEDGSLIFVDKIPDTCDIVYKQYNCEYGLPSKEFYDYFKRGESPVVVVNDAKTLEKLERMFGPTMIALFCHDKKPTIESIVKLSMQRGAYTEQDARARFEKAEAIYKIYTENIQLFNSAILNTNKTDNFGDLTTIVNNFARQLPNLGRNGIPEQARLYLVAGAPIAKDLIIRNAKEMGAQAVVKCADRVSNKDDGAEIICTDNPEYAKKKSKCDIHYKNYGREYDLNTKTIWEGLANDKSQIAVVSDMKTVEEIKGKFGEFAVVCYAHSDMTKEEYSTTMAGVAKPDYIDATVQAWDAPYKRYLSNPAIFDRVLISVDSQQDFITQMKNTIYVPKPDKSASVVVPRGIEPLIAP